MSSLGLSRTTYIIDDTVNRAIEVLKGNSTEFGLRASQSYYQQVWARDAFISFLGANMLRDPALIDSAKTTLMTLGKCRSSLGQIPNYFNLNTRGPEYGFSAATDSSTWYIIGLMSLYHATESRELLQEPLDAALEAFRWLRYQDANNTWLIDSPQGGDWMDAAVRRTGKTLYNNILFLLATRSINKLCEISGRANDKLYKLEEELLKERFNNVFLPRVDSYERVKTYWPYIADRIRDDPPAESLGYYVHFISFSHFDLHFDTLSNLLCVLTNVASNDLSQSILEEIRSRQLGSPYPVRVLDPPYHEGDQGFDVDFNRKIPIQHRSEPYNYHNGGIWPFVGGFYVLALQKIGSPAAREQLERLSQVNNVYKEGESLGFNEWLSGRDARPGGQSGQSWNAGMLIAAHEGLKGNDVFAFLK